jgi:biotin carboxylase
MREVLADAGVPSPRSELVSIDEDPHDVARRVVFPCVVKPLFLSASRGVIRADDPAQFAGAFRRLTAILRRPEVAAEGGPLAQQILVETFIPGIEVALEGLLSEGKLRVLALFDKPDPLEGPFFEETIYVTPSRLPAPLQQAIAVCAEDAVRALGLQRGPVHAELRLND